MRTIEAIATVNEDGTLTVQVEGVTPGQHPVVLVIDEHVVTREREPLDLTPYPVGIAVDNFTFRREDLYADDDA